MKGCFGNDGGLFDPTSLGSMTGMIRYSTPSDGSRISNISK